MQLFDTVAPKSHVFPMGADFDPKSVVDFLSINNQEVSRIASVAKASVRYDADMPRAVRERLEEIANVANMVADIFDGDEKKTALWFRSKNPMLGDISPRDMVRMGRYDRLRRFVVNAIADRCPSLSG